METIGANIKFWREDRDMTQRELADKVYVTPQAVQQWETEKTLPAIDKISDIADALNVSVYHILYDDMTPFKEYKLNYTNLYEHKKKEYMSKNYKHAVTFMNTKLRGSNYELIYSIHLTQFEYYQFITYATERGIKNPTDDDLMSYLLKYNSNFNMLFFQPYIVECMMTGKSLAMPRDCE